MENKKRRPQIAMLINNTMQNRQRSSWGGTVDCITQTLQKHCGDVHSLGSIRSPHKLAGKVINKAAHLLLKKNYLYNHTFALAKFYARTVAPRLAASPFDVIIAPGGGTEIAFLQTDIPIVLIEDANFARLHNYYAEYSHLLKSSAYQTSTLEALAVQKASLIVHPSPWAVSGTLDTYHVDPEKVHAIPFGANFDAPPPLEIVQQKKRSTQCRLLFIGVDWERKGGEIAFETLLELEKMGIQANLIVVGCTPPTTFSHERMRVIAYLDKRVESQRKELEDLFATCDFLLLPTRGECYGMVFCEASAYGLPSITTDTGGVCGAITNGENGFRLPLSARGPEYAELIARIYRDEASYDRLVTSSRAAFDSRLNWDAWGATVTELIHAMLARRQLSSGASFSAAQS